MGRICYGCGAEIPAERLETLPGTETCVKCSKVKKVIGIVQGAGYMGSSKGYTMEIVSGDNKLARTFVNMRKGRSWGKHIGGGNLRDAGSFI